MKKEIVIDGIMRFECDHKYLYWFLEIDGVKKTKVKTKDRKVTVFLNKNVEDKEFYKKLENTGYKIISIDTIEND